MSLKRFPFLMQLQDDLTRLSVIEMVRAASAPPVPPGMHLVRYPGLGEFVLTKPQLKVVRELMSALLHSRSPEVDQRHLISIAGKKCRKLSELSEIFAGSRAWGTLVIPGKREGCYRLAEVGAADASQS